MGAKFCSTGVLDGLFAPIYVAGGNLMTVIMSSSDVVPTIGGSSTGSTGCLARSTVGGYMSTGYFTIATSSSGRCCTISACSCDDVIQTGVASYVCIVDDASSIRYVTTCTTQTLSSGNKVNIGSWSITIAQPT